MSEHAYPTTGREHVTTGFECWCGPSFFLPCDECDRDGCWKCDRGLIRLDRSEALASTEPLVIVHEDVPHD